MIRVILWDIDGTLLDFKAAEKTGLVCLLNFQTYYFTISSE